MKVTVIGAGNMGSAFVKQLVRAGHEVSVTARSSAKAEQVAAAHPGARAVPAASAAAGADAIVLATGYGDAVAALKSVGDVQGKVVIDITNPLSADYMSLTLDHSNSAAEEIAKAVPAAEVVKGFNTVFASVLAQAGATVTDDVEVFDDLFYMAGTLHAKRIGGDRLAAASGAGFEAVSAADAIVGETFSMRMATLSADTVGRIEAVLAEKKLAALVEVRNPLDMNPGADDDAHVRITAAMIEDSEVDAVVVGLDPTAPMVRALEQSRLRPGYDLSDPESTVHTLPPLVARTDKPIVAVVDAGRLYDAMAAGLMDRGVCVFRNVARGTRALVRHVEARLDAERIRRHFGQS